MPRYICTTYPQLKIFNPVTGDYASFVGGLLEIDEDDPNYEVVHAEALRNPSISIMVNRTTCQYCGESFTGKAAAAQLGKHTKDIHPDVWDAEQVIKNAKIVETEVKRRAGYACDVCAPVQEFGSAAALSDHVKLLHTAAPELDDEGNDKAEPKGRRGGERAVPAATART